MRRRSVASGERYVLTDGGASVVPSDPPPGPQERHRGWIPPALLALYSIIGLVVLQSAFDDVWFLNDDWDLIAGAPIDRMFVPVEEHWSTIPILLLQLLYRGFGAHIRPFLITANLIHLAVVALLYLLMRRARVDAWIAAAAAATLVLFGPGYLSILYPIQITQNLSIVFGLSQMMLADHDGVDRRRDALAVGAGAMAVMSSGVGPVIVLATGLSVLLRRGRRAAAWQAVPLLGLYAAWFMWQQPVDPAYKVAYVLGDHVAFVRAGLWDGVAEFTHFAWVAAVFVPIALFGAFLCVKEAALSESTRKRIAVPCALAVAAVVYLIVVGYQRSAIGSQYAGYSHHVYTVVVFLLPAIACSLDQIVRSWPRLLPIVTILLVLAIPFHLQGFEVDRRPAGLQSAQGRAVQDWMEVVAHSPYADAARQIDRDKVISGGVSPALTLGWVVDEGRAGRIPEPADVDPFEEGRAQLLFGLTDVGPEQAPTTCRELPAGTQMQPEVGDVIHFPAPVVLFDAARGAESRAFVELAEPGRTVRVELPGMQFAVTSGAGDDTVAVCAGVS